MFARGSAHRSSQRCSLLVPPLAHCCIYFHAGVAERCSAHTDTDFHVVPTTIATSCVGSSLPNGIGWTHPFTLSVHVLHLHVEPCKSSLQSETNLQGTFCNRSSASASCRRAPSREGANTFATFAKDSASAGVAERCSAPTDTYFHVALTTIATSSVGSSFPIG